MPCEAITGQPSLCERDINKQKALFRLGNRWVSCISQQIQGEAGFGIGVCECGQCVRSSGLYCDSGTTGTQSRWQDQDSVPSVGCRYKCVQPGFCGMPTQRWARSPCGSREIMALSDFTADDRGGSRGLMGCERLTRGLSISDT